VFGVLFVYCELGNAYGLGHTDGQHKLVPTLVTRHLLQGARVGCCHNLPLMHALNRPLPLVCIPSLAVARRRRLQQEVAIRGGRSSGKARRQLLLTRGKDCECVTMTGELVQWVAEACVSWPEGRAGDLGGVAWLLGSGMMKARGSM